MDVEELRWAREQLERKSRKDIGLIHQIFTTHYSKLLDMTIRTHHKQMCAHCLTGKGDSWCKGPTGKFVLEIGSDVLKFAADDMKQTVWEQFLKAIASFFKKDIMKWFIHFDGVDIKIDTDRDLISRFMLNHFPNRSDNSEQLFQNYHDHDEEDM